MNCTVQNMSKKLLTTVFCTVEYLKVKYVVRTHYKYRSSVKFDFCVFLAIFS